MTDVEMKDANENQPVATAAVEEQKEPQDKYYGKYFPIAYWFFQSLRRTLYYSRKRHKIKTSEWQAY
jgi:hypothetical protein